MRESMSRTLIHKGKRGLAMVMAVLTVVTSVSWPTTTVKAETICSNHTVHDENCGYVEAVAGSPCNHVHDGYCGYVEGDAESPCNHVHDGNCGYVEAIEGQPCRHTCSECNSSKEESGSNAGLDERVTALANRIKALPKASVIKTYTEEEKEELLAELKDIGDLIDTYCEEGLIDEDGELYTKLYAALLACNGSLIGDSAETLAEVNLTASEDSSSTYVPTQIINGDFEKEPFMTYTYNGTTYTRNPLKKADDDYVYDSSKSSHEFFTKGALNVSGIVFNGVDQGWNTTETQIWKGNLFEWWPWKNNYADAKPYVYNSNITTGSNSSNAYVEMNNCSAAVLYQDLSTYGGDVIRWTLDHAVVTSGDNDQSIRVEIGAPNGNASGVGNSINTNIVDATRAQYTKGGVTNGGTAYGFGKTDELKYLSLSKTNQADKWYTASGVYVIPDNQSVSRFAFVSTAATPNFGNLLDEITFSTLIGNLQATTDTEHEGGITVYGYWGETATDKKLVVKFDNDHVSYIDMSSVIGNNFKITIPKANIPDGAKSVEIYHEDYESAKKTIEIHNWTFSSEANKIIATCDITGCSSPNVSLTLNAANSAYTGEPVTATVSRDAAFPAAIGESNVVYYREDGTTKTTPENSGATAEGKAPVNVGSYVAKITAGGKTAETTVTIKSNQIASVTIGNNITYYNSFADALDAANNATQDCRLTILNSCSHSGPSAISNVNGKKITLDVGDADTTLTITATANGQKLLTVSTDVDFVGDGGKIVFDLNNWNDIKGVYAGNACTIRMFDGFNILAKDGGTDERVFWIQNGPKCYIYGGSIETSNIKTASTIVCTRSSLYIYDGEFGWNITGNGGYYWSGVTDSCEAVAFEIYGGYFNGPLWVGNTESTEFYKFYGGKFTTNKLKTNPNNVDGTTEWTKYIVDGNTVSYIDETKNGVTYNYEIVNPNVVSCSAISSNEAYGTATVSASKAKKNDKVVFTASPKEGHAFVEWQYIGGENDGTKVATDDAVYSVNVTEDTNLRAVFKVCNHEVWAYTENGPTIYANCATKGCTRAKLNASLTLNAPASSLYTGNPIGVTVTRASDFPITENVSDSDVKYYLEDGVTLTNSANSGATSEGGKPKNVGKYVAKLIAGGATAQKNFRITSAQSVYQPLAISSSSLNGNTVYGKTESGNCMLDQSAGFYVNGRGYLTSGGFPEDGAISINNVPYQLAYGGNTATAFNGNDSIRLTSSYKEQTMNLETYGSYENIYVLGTAGGPGSGHYANFSVVLTYTDETTSETTYKLYDWYDSKSETNVYKDPQFMRSSYGSSSDGSTYGGPYVQSATISADKSKLLKSITFKMTGKDGGSNCSGLYCGIYAVTGKVGTGAPEQTEISGTPMNVTTNSFLAVWDEVPGATSYRLDVATDINFSNMLSDYNNKDVGNVLEYLVTGLQPNTTYYYRVRAVKDNVPGLSSDPIEVETLGHVHKWTYSDDGNKIIATCTCTDASELYDYCEFKDKTGDDRKIVLTLNAVNKSNTGTAYDGISIEGLDNFNKKVGSKIKADAVVFYEEDRVTKTGSADGAATDGAAPINQNKYVAKLAYQYETGNYVTAIADFEIERPHGHENMLYTAVENMIFAECKDTYYPEDCSLPNRKASITLETPSVNYSGSAYSSASIDGLSTFNAGTGLSVDDSAIVYYLADGTTKTTADNSGADGIGNAPKNAGIYVAKITVGGATAESIFQIYKDATTPEAPSTLYVYSSTDAAGLKCNELKIIWNGLSNATGYQVDVAEDSAFSDAKYVSGWKNKSVTTASCTVTGLKQNTTYYVRVRSVVSGVASDSSDKVSGKTATHNLTYEIDSTDAGRIIAKCKYCNLTSNVSITAYDAIYTGNAVKATIIADSDFPCSVEEADVVYYLEDGKALTSKANCNAASSGKAPVKPGKYVAKLTIGGVVAQASFQIKQSDGSQPPTTVNIYSAKDMTGNLVTFRCDQLLLSWNAVNGVSEYKVDIAKDENFNEILTGYDGKSVSQTSLLVIGLEPKTTYYARVRSVLSGTEGTNSEPVSTKTCAHDYEYSLDKNDVSKIHAICSNCGLSSTVTISATDANYSGSPVNATIDCSADFPVAIGDLVVEYYHEDGKTKTTVSNSGANETGAAPVNAGSYVATVQIRNGLFTKVTAICNFKINKVNQSIDAPTATTENNRNTSVILTPVTAYGDVLYAVSRVNVAPTDETVWQESTTFTGLVKNTSYYFFAKTNGDVNHYGAASVGSTITTNNRSEGAGNPGTPAAPSDPEGSPTDGPTIPSGEDFNPDPDIYTSEPDFPGTPTGEVTTSTYYEGREGTTYGPSKTKPTAAGKYYLVIEKEDRNNSYTTKYPFVIAAKEEITGGTGVTPVNEPEGPSIPRGKDYNPDPDIYSGTPQIPGGSSEDAVTTYYYEGREGTSYARTTVKPTAVGKYNLIIHVENSKNWTEQILPFEITATPINVTPTSDTPDGPLIPKNPASGTTPDPTEDGNWPKPLIIADDPTLPGAEGTVTTTYTYEGRDETSYGPSATRPTEAGKYNLVITMTDSNQTSVKKLPFEITGKTSGGTPTGITPASGPEGGDPVNPGDPSSPTIPEIPYDPVNPFEPNPDVITGTPGIAEGTGTAVTTYIYTGRDSTTYPATGTETTVKPTDVGDYYLIVRVQNDTNIAEEKYPFSIVASKAPTPNAANFSKLSGNVIDETIDGKSNGVIKGLGATVAYDYSFDGENYTAVPVGKTSIENLPAGKVYLRQAKAGNYLESDPIEITIGRGVYVKHGENIWTVLLNNLTFGKYFNKTQKVTVENSNNNSIQSISYYVTNYEMTAAQLSALPQTSWADYGLMGISLNPIDQQVAYVRVEAKSGEVIFLSSDGYYIDDAAPVISGIESNTTYTTDGAVAFTVSDTCLDKVVVTKADGTSEILLSNNHRNELGVGVYESVSAVDLAGNKTVLKNITVKKGQNQPSFGEPVLPEDPTKPVTPTADGGPYEVFDPSDGEYPGKPVFTYKYNPTYPGTADVTLADGTPGYEIYMGPLDGDGNPTVGPLTGSPINVPTDTPIYIRKKGSTEPETEPSGFTPYVIPGVPTTTVTVAPSPSGSGTVTLDDPYNHGNPSEPGSDDKNPAKRKFYVGKDIELNAEPKPGYKFSGWVNKKTGEVISTENPYIFTPNTPDEANNICALFVVDDDDAIKIPSGTTGVQFTYDGSEKVGFDESTLPEHVTIKPGSTTKATNVGLYKYELELEPGYQWEDGTKGTKSFSWKINKKPTSSVPGLDFDKDNKRVNVTNVPTGRKIEYKYGTNGEVATSEDVTTGTTYFSPTTTGDSTGQILNGEYYVRVAGDDNNEPGAWTKIKVDAGGVAITTLPSGPGKDDEGKPDVTLNAVVTPTDKIKKVTIRYRKKGESGWQETDEIPASDPISYSFPDGKTPIEPGVEYEYQLDITSEGDTPADDDDVHTYGDLLTYRLPREGENTDDGDDTAGTGVITGVVTNNTGKQITVVLSIEKGNTSIASQVSKLSVGGTFEARAFTGLKKGSYNIVLRSIDGSFVETQLIDVGDGQQKNVSFTLKAGEIKTLVAIKSGAPALAVGGLTDIITTADIDNAATGLKSVEVRMDVEEENNQLVREEIQGRLDNNQVIGDILDITLTRIESTLDGSGNVTGINSQDIGSTNNVVLEMAIPYNTNDPAIDVFRDHENNISKFTKLSSRPSSNFTDGTVYIGDGYLYVYASGYSSYVIVKSPDQNNGGGGSGSGNSYSDSGSGSGIVVIPVASTLAGSADGNRLRVPKTDDPLPLPTGDNVLSFSLEAMVEKREEEDENMEA